MVLVFVSFLLAATELGRDCFELLRKDEKRLEATASVAAANEVSMDAAIAAKFIKTGCHFFTTKKNNKQRRRARFVGEEDVSFLLTLFDKSLVKRRGASRLSVTHRRNKKP